MVLDSSHTMKSFFILLWINKQFDNCSGPHMKMKSHHSVAPPWVPGTGGAADTCMHSSHGVGQGCDRCTASLGRLYTVTPSHAPSWLEQASSHLHLPHPLVPYPHTVSLSSLVCPAHLTLTFQKGAISF